LAALGTLSDRVARLRELAPGELSGVLDLGGNGCSQQTVDLGTLARSTTPRDICAVPGGQFGIRLRDVRRSPRALGVVDLDGRLTETIAIPNGWDWWGVARQGIVMCHEQDGLGRLRRFGGATTPLPSCPLTQDRARLLFAGAGRRTIVDEAGNRI